MAVPKLDLFISLFGALCLAALGIAIPAIVDMNTHWYQMKGFPFLLSLAKNLFLIVFGIAGLVVGTYTSIHDIAESFANN